MACVSRKRDRFVSLRGAASRCRDHKIYARNPIADFVAQLLLGLRRVPLHDRKVVDCYPAGFGSTEGADLD